MIFYLHRKEFIGKKIGLPQRNEIAYNSSSKMMNSAFFGQIIILIVFIPVLALQGVEGKMFIPNGNDFWICRFGCYVVVSHLYPYDGLAVPPGSKNNKKTWGEKFI